MTIQEHFRNMEAFALDKLNIGQTEYSKGWYDGIAFAYREALKALDFFTTIAAATAPKENTHESD